MLEQILNFISFFIIFKADENLSEGKKKKAMLLNWIACQVQKSDSSI